MRRFVLIISAVLLFTACGKKVRVAAPPPVRPATDAAAGTTLPPASAPPTSTPAASTPATSAPATSPAETASRTADPSPNASANAELVGLASYYAEPYHGRKTANGETFDTYQELTAAHRTLPFNTVVKVMNQDNGRDVEVRINDRGPFIDGRVIDLSLKAAREIDMVRAGVVPVRLQILQEGTAPVRGAVRASGPAAIYAIQVAALDSQAAAESMKRDLERRYRDVSIEAVSVNRTFYRVRVGRTDDLKSAEKLIEQLRDESFDPFVVRLN